MCSERPHDGGEATGLCRTSTMRCLALVAGCLSAGGCVDSQPERSAAPGADTVRMGIEWQVAPGLHPSADSLGNVSGVAVDANGNVYVSDQLAAKIWVFDDSGELRTAIGGKGQGPGELEAPTGPAISPDGRLYVRDVSRVTVFGPDSATGLSSRLEGTFPGPTYADWTSKRATRFESSGAMLYPGDRWLEDGTAAPYLYRYAPDGDLTDSIFVTTYPNAPQLTAHYRVDPRNGRMLPGLNHVPFAPLPVWDVTAERTIISGDGRSYTLFVTDYNGTVQDTIRRSIAPDRIPAEERRDSLDALRARLDSVPVPFDQVEGMPESVRDLDVPDTYPAYRAVHVGEEGEVWVRRWALGGADRTVFDVFTHGGEYDRTVVLPRAIRVEPTPHLSKSGVVGVTTHPLTDEYIVIRFAPTAPR